jgi:hypothetical protein
MSAVESIIHIINRLPLKKPKILIANYTFVILKTLRS